jgi:alpha-beta hydrolase superfamily lysophospholipase
MKEGCFMSNEEFSFDGKDQKSIHTYMWNDVEKPKAVLQIFHGMAEHAGRYAEFAGFLNKRGYIVYADDHRGHGKTAGISSSTDAGASDGVPVDLGYVGKDGFSMIVEDEHVLHGIIKEKHTGLPVFVLAHSFGSFLGQEYIIRYGGEIAGAMLSGSAMKKGADVKAGRVLSSVMMLLGGKKKNALIDRLGFKEANARIANPRTTADWLSRDEAVVDKYMNDPCCGKVATTNFYYCLFKGLSGLYKSKRLVKIPKELPIYILSGDNDPIGSYGTSTAKLYEMYRELGIKDVGLKLFEGCRHEILNETNRQEVYEEMADWLDSHLTSCSEPKPKL